MMIAYFEAASLPAGASGQAEAELDTIKVSNWVEITSVR
jgi:hypothetical protein